MVDSAGNCQACEDPCEYCNTDGTCSTCLEGVLFNGGCLATCPKGFRRTRDNECVACSEGCSDCYSQDLGGYEQEQCLECAKADEYLQESGGRAVCVEHCRDGWYADDLLKWCVACSCECEKCEGARDQCTSCAGLAQMNEDGECEVLSTREPYAKFDSDWNSFKLTVPEAFYYVGHRTDFLNEPEAPVLTCKDELLSEDWGNPDFTEELAAINAKLDALMNEHEKRKISELVSSIESIPQNSFGHASEIGSDIIHSKIWYSVADSLFGRPRSEVQSRPINTDALACLIDFNIDELCDLIFLDNAEQNLIKSRLGDSRKCQFNFAESCDPGKVLSGDNGCTQVQSVIDVQIDMETANMSPNMELTLGHAFYPYDITPSVGTYANSPFAPMKVIVEPADAPYLITLPQLWINQDLIGEFPEANCNTGILADWSETQGLCGEVPVGIVLENVFDLDSLVPLDPTDAQEKFNDFMLDEFDGETLDRELQVPGSYIAPFIGKRLDLAVTFRNCNGDRETLRGQVYVTDDELVGLDEAGQEVTYAAGACAAELLG